MHYWQFTLIFLSTYSLVNAGSANHNQPCDTKNNKLQAGSFQFFSDCNSVNFCLGANNTCQPKGCRKDDFPFGYNDPSTFPPKCPRGSFCPDEADACVPWQPVGFPCQLNRDDQCEAPPNFQELADTTHKGLNFNGSVCLHNTCMWANITEGDACIVENTGYTAYSPAGEFIDIVSRHNCRTGFYCDSIQLICIKNKLTGEACDADKECETYNCLTNNVCGVSADTAHHFSIGVYAGVGVAILGGMFATLFGLFFLHRRHRDQEREKRVQYWREQNAFHQNLLQMRETARASLHTLPGDRHDGYSDETHAPIMHGGAPKGSGLRYMSDEGSEYDEAYIMQQPPQRPVEMGRF